MGKTILGIDMRPATGQLYALGSSSRLYTINTPNGAAAAVGAMLFSPALNGTSFGFDFNPTVDRIRVVSNTGQNFRLNPITGALAMTDLNLKPGTSSVGAAAYKNNFPGATTTELYTLDFVTDFINEQDPPNMGTQVPVGSLGINIDASNGFDIGGASGIGYAILSTGATTKLYVLNLDSGAANAGVSFPLKSWVLR